MHKISEKNLYTYNKPVNPSKPPLFSDCNAGVGIPPHAQGLSRALRCLQWPVSP